MNRLFSFAFALVVLAFLTQGGTDLWAKPPKPKQPPHWKNIPDQYSEISAVNVAANTVTIHHVGGTIKEDRTLAITTFSDIKVDDKKATISDLKPKMRVDYSLGGDGTSLDRLETLTPPPPPPTPVPTPTPYPRGNKP